MIAQRRMTVRWGPLDMFHNAWTASEAFWRYDIDQDIDYR